MTKKFIDMQVYSKFSEGKDSPDELVDFAKKLEIKGLCFADYNEKNIKHFKKLEAISNDFHSFSRINFIANNINTLKRFLGQYRHRVHVIAVIPRNKEIAVFAGRDQRVDLVSFFEFDSYKLLTNSVGKMVKESDTAIEISIAPLLRTYRNRRSKLMHVIHDGLLEIKRIKPPIVFSTGAINKYELRAPREIIAIAEMLGVPEETAKESVYFHPWRIIQRNLKRLQNGYIMDGVEIHTEEEEDFEEEPGEN